MISKQQLGMVVHELQQTILNLIDKNILLQQSRKESGKVNAIIYQKQINQLKTNIQSLNLSLKQTLSKLQASQNLISSLQIQLQEKNKKINEYQTQTLTSCTIRNQLEQKNKQLENDLNDLKRTIEQKNLVINNSFIQIEQIKKKQSDHQYDASVQLKELQLSSQIQDKIYMLLFNKQKKYRDLKKQNMRLNDYLNDVTKNQKYEKNINWKLIQDELKKQIQLIDKQIKKQFHLIINSNKDNDRNQVSNNLQVLLKNFQKDIDSLFLNNVK